MKDLLEQVWMEGWYSCNGAGSDTPDINIEEYKQQIDSAIKQYLALQGLCITDDETLNRLLKLEK